MKATFYYTNYRNNYIQNSICQLSEQLESIELIEYNLKNHCKKQYKFRLIISNSTTRLMNSRISARKRNNRFLVYLMLGGIVMSCFLVPTAEAIVTSVISKNIKAHEGDQAEAGKTSKFTADGKFTWKTKLSWLNSMLWGGAILLCLEHIWHGEVVFYPPFLTAMSDPADTTEMLHEMGTVGVGMAVLATVAWGVLILVADRSNTIKFVLGQKGA